jgi:hypothetical protein
MDEAQYPDFCRLVGDVHKYYRADLSAFILGSWWSSFRSLALEDVTEAFERHVRDPERGRFCPKVADLVAILGGTPSERAVIAWGKVLDAMTRVGAYSDVVFDQPQIHAAVADMGGWPKLCRTELSELSFFQHRFMELFRAYSQRGTQGYPRVLIGDRSSDEEYKRKGIAVPTPVLIGNPEACARVWAGGGDSRALITHLRPGTDLAALALDAVVGALPSSGQEDE